MRLAGLWHTFIHLYFFALELCPDQRLLCNAVKLWTSCLTRMFYSCPCCKCAVCSWLINSVTPSECCSSAHRLLPSATSRLSSTRINHQTPQKVKESTHAHTHDCGSVTVHIVDFKLLSVSCLCYRVRSAFRCTDRKNGERHWRIDWLSAQWRIHSCAAGIRRNFWLWVEVKLMNRF